MRYLIRVIELILLVVLIAVTVQNSHSVEFKLFASYIWQAPLIVFLLIFFVLGAITGLTATFSYYFRMRREVSRLKKELRNRPYTPATVVSDPSEKIAD